MREHPKIVALQMKQAEKVGELRRQIWAEQAEARKTCTHPPSALVEEDVDHSEPNMSRPLRWRERRCMTCNSVVAKTVEIWVCTDAIGNAVFSGGKYVEVPKR